MAPATFIYTFVDVFANAVVDAFVNVFHKSPAKDKNQATSNPVIVYKAAITA